MKNWIDFAKEHKAFAVQKTERGDVFPTIIVERNQELLAVVMAPELDKMLGLQAAHMCKIGFDPDSLTLVLDAHMHQSKRKDNQTFEEMEEEYRSKFPKGLQFAHDEENEIDEIVDCLICHRINRQGEISIVALPYTYQEGKNPLKWLDSDPNYKDIYEEEMCDKDGEQLKGYIPESLRSIMSQSDIDQKFVEQVKNIAKDFDYEPERLRYHVARAMISILNNSGFFVVDLVSGRHPEWSGAKNKAYEVIDLMINTGMLPSEADEPMKQIVDEYIGKPNFVENLTELLKDHVYWLPDKIRDDVEEFCRGFESFCILPEIEQ